MRLILASASPRRAELLASAGFDFEISPADVDESPLPEEDPGAYALRVATDKAARVPLDRRKSGTVVLGADTVVVAGNRILGKPADDSEAAWMLKQLSGAVHVVLTAVVLRTRMRQVSEVVSTRVHLLPLTEDEIRWYINTREPDGKAGAYAIQGRAARFIDWIEGSWSNVVGLPLATVYQLLREVGTAIDPV
jgi:septum formation protein